MLVIALFIYLFYCHQIIYNQDQGIWVKRSLIAESRVVTSQELELVGEVRDSWPRLSEEEDGVEACPEAKAGHAYLAVASLATGSGKGSSSALSLVL